jgi:hypothetical protein
MALMEFDLQLWSLGTFDQESAIEDRDGPTMARNQDTLASPESVYKYLSGLSTRSTRLDLVEW